MSTGLASPPVELVLSRLENIRRSGCEWSAKCPAHDDKRNSLSIGEGMDGKALLYCHAGCEYADIIAALVERGLDHDALSNGRRGYRLEDYARDKGLSIPFLRQLGVRTDEETWGRPVVAIPYLDANRQVVGHRYRAENGDKWQDRGVKLTPYGLDRLPSDKDAVLLVEGESDCHAAWHHKLDAVVGIPGANAWRSRWAAFFQKRDIYIWQEPGDAAAEFVKKIAADFPQARVIQAPNGIKDLCELHIKHPNEFEERLKVLVEGAHPLCEDDRDAKDTKSATGSGAPRLSQATLLVEMAADVELFHTPAGEAYATIGVHDHRETWPLKTKGFRRWLARRFYESEGKTPNSQAVQAALAVLEGRALFDAGEQAVFTRLAEQHGAIYLDLANDRWEVVEITPSGWQVLTDPSVKFRRAKGMAPLPHPVAGGSISELRPFVNVASDDDWALFVAWLVAALRPRGPYPVLTLHGEQGNAKSTTARVAKACLDPNDASLRAEPRDVRDLMIAATNGWCVALDNVSRLPPWLSDAICRLATGGGFATRELYTDSEEILFEAQRPVVLNGIEEVATRGDLLDRALILYLPRIADSCRRPESEFWAEFEAARPRILGALLDAVAGALRNLPAIKPPVLPRMADFAVWAMAVETALGWDPATFMEAYTGNRDAVNALALESSPVASVVCEQAASGKWEGTATELLQALNARTDDAIQRQKSWPRSPRALSGILRRLAPNLRAVGVEVDFSREAGGKRRRMITVKPGHCA